MKVVPGQIKDSIVVSRCTLFFSRLYNGTRGVGRRHSLVVLDASRDESPRVRVWIRRCGQGLRFRLPWFRLWYEWIHDEGSLESVAM